MKCIHLDFHTSPAIDGIGLKFNKAEFTKMVKDAKTTYTITITNNDTI